MKTSVVAYLLILVAVLFAPSVFAQNIQEGLVGCWNFDDGNANDSSGSEHHGKLIDDATIVDDAQRGEVLQLDGDGDHVDCGGEGPDSWASIPNAKTDGIAVTAWVKLDTPGPDGWQMVIDKSVCYRFQVRNDTNTDNILWCMRRIGDNTNLASADLTDEEWHHLAGTYDGSELKTYLDGTLIHTNPAQGNWEKRDHPLLIGQYGYCPGPECWFLKGRLDDVRLYERDLSADDIDEIIRVTSAVSPSGKLATTWSKLKKH